MSRAYSTLGRQLRLQKEEDVKHVAAQPAPRVGLLPSAFLPTALIFKQRDLILEMPFTQALTQYFPRLNSKVTEIELPYLTSKLSDLHLQAAASIYF